MKLAVIDHVGNPGGGSRVVRALLPALKRLRPELEITYFGSRASMVREAIYDEFPPLDIRIRELRSTVLANEGLWGIEDSKYAFRKLQIKYGDRLRFLPVYLSGAVHRELEKKVKDFDLAFFPWPFLLRCPLLTCPMVGIFHDFNYRYYFTGSPTFPKSYYDMICREMPVWLARSTPVVSTHFMAGELAKFYPEHAHRVEVVHLAAMSVVSQIAEGEDRRIVTEDLGIRKDYILYPTNPSAHKNLGPLLAAIPRLRAMGHDVCLVLTGPGMERMNGHACGIGVELGFGEQDVFGLGYVSNMQMDALIQRASVVVSTSLYEAGNGPGIDAWARGVPVAMSNIPAFIEHLEVQGVKAAVFDPRSPEDIAQQIHPILADPARAKADAIASQQALSRFTWEQTARKYLAVFDKAIEGARRG